MIDTPLKGIVFLSVWFLGWLISIPHALRAHMQSEVCDVCGRDWQGHKPSLGTGHEITDVGTFRRNYGPVPLGAVRDRKGIDVAWAMLVAFIWPFALLLFVARHTALIVGRTTVRAVNAVTPLTAPELERRIEQQRLEIERLQREIERG